MTLISSRLTGFYKRGFPVLWFSIIAAILGVAFLAAKPAPPLLLLPIALLAVIGWLFMRAVLFDLADAVHDAGDALVVKRSGQEERIPLANVMNVSSTQCMNPPRLTLRLVHPGRLGPYVSFISGGRRAFNPFAPSPIAEALIERAYAARTRATR
jgi:hypothetical protein